MINQNSMMAETGSSPSEPIMFQYGAMKPTKIFRRLRMLLSSSSAIPSSIELGPEWKEAAKSIATAKKVAVLTGAGMSAESGIATFRAKEGGVWKQFNPSEVATPMAFKTNPHKVLAWHQSMRSICQSAEPNAGHYAIANLQALVPEVIVITQNIDGLHQRAGSKYVLEMHCQQRL